MRLVDLPRTGSFRLALLFLLLFGVSSAVLFGFLYIQTQQFIIANIDNWLDREAPAPFHTPLPELRSHFDAHAANASGRLERIFTLYSEAGQVLAGDPLPMPKEVGAFDMPFDFSVPTPKVLLRYRGIAHRFPGGETALIAQNMHEPREFDEAFISTMVWGGLLTALLGLAGAAIVGTGTVKRLDAVALAIQKIVSGDLSRRLPTHGTSGDLDRLAHVVNGMLDDIERLMHDVKGVCDGIAHDLRTPLTRILAGLERAQRRATTPDEYAEVVDDAIIEIRCVLRTFSAMLRIAELEDSARRAGFARVDVEQVAQDVVEYYEPVAEERRIEMRLERRSDGPFILQGDASLLFDAIANLVDNALKYTPAGGNVTAELEHVEGCIVIAVRDTGCGIPSGEREAVLRRFYRSEESRHTPGNGLGLALVAAVARLHNLNLTIEAAAPGSRITLSQQTSPA
jgi:signal transduction histidine kinase